MLEQHEEYNGYAYGAPGTNVKREIEPFDSGSGTGGGLAYVSTNNPGCLGLVAGCVVMMFSFVFEWRKAELKAETIKYQADRNLDAVVAQVSGRLEDTTRHLQAGISPGVSIHDIDRTSWGVSQSPPAEQPPPPHVGTGAMSPPPGWDPYVADVEIDPDTGGWEDVN